MQKKDRYGREGSGWSAMKMSICLLNEPLSAGKNVVYMMTVCPGMISPLVGDTKKIGGGISNTMLSFLPLPATDPCDDPDCKLAGKPSVPAASRIS